MPMTDAATLPPPPAHIPAGRGLWLIARAALDPLAVTKDILDTYGPFAVMRMPALRKINTKLDLPFAFTVGARFNREVLTNPNVWRMMAIFRGGPRGSALSRLSNGLARIRGSRHAHYRRAFDRPIRKMGVDRMIGDMTRIVREETADWPVDQPIDLRSITYPLMRTFSIDLIFGGDRTRALPLARDINAMLQQEWTPSVMACPVNLPGVPYGNMLRGAENIERCLLDWADGVRGKPDDNNLLSIVVNGADEDGTPADNAAIVGHLTQLFSATFETCQTLLTSALVLLAQHPKVARDLLDEVRGALQDAEPTINDLAKLPLLEAVIKETLRILPPVPLVPRVATEDTSIAGYPMPKGARIVLNPFLTNRMPDLYPDPDCFKPERWATTNPGTFEYLTFSAGPRACPGFGFAMNALKVALAVVVQRYRVALEPATNVSYWVRPLLYPSGEIRAVLRRQDGAYKAEAIGGNIRRLVSLPT